MTSLFEAAPYLAAYQYSFAVLSALALIALVQSFLLAPLAFVSQEQMPGIPLAHGHSKLYQNTVENLPALTASLIVAIIAGAQPWLINGLAIGYLLCRLAFWAIYYSGIGAIAGGPRTIAYVGGLLTNIGIVGVGLFALLA